MSNPTTSTPTYETLTDEVNAGRLAQRKRDTDAVILRARDEYARQCRLTRHGSFPRDRAAAKVRARRLQPVALTALSTEGC